MAASPLSLAGSPPTAPILLIQTSKEWVLPPRPKPGRKPSVDTPASKRKAQNRAAQRAFRERRATRVQELEEKLAEVEKERDVKEMGLVNTINKLRVENQFLLKSLEQLRGDVAGIRNARVLPNVSPSSSTYSVQQISPAPLADSPPNFSYRNHLHPTPMSADPTPARPRGTSDFDCGVCVKNECLCEDVGLKTSSQATLNDLLDTFTPVAAVPLKRKAAQSGANGNNTKDRLETDFTRHFSTASSRPLPDLKRLKRLAAPKMADVVVQDPAPKKMFDEGSPVDNCGFCSDDTPCVCREAAKEAAQISQTMAQNGNGTMNEDDLEDSEDEEVAKMLPPIQNSAIRKASLPVMHPGPSVEIREITNLNAGLPESPQANQLGLNQGLLGQMGANSSMQNQKNQSQNQRSQSPQTQSQTQKAGCTGNPGTCEQCQMDPMSTLFCSTVANKANESNERSTDRSASEPLPSRTLSRTGSRASVPMALTSAPSTPGTPSSVPGPAGMFIPCADAYKTLSRHKQFNLVDFGTLVGKLTTRGMQVEVQSVANVLRELDRRVYN